MEALPLPGVVYPLLELHDAVLFILITLRRS